LNEFFTNLTEETSTEETTLPVPNPLRGQTLYKVTKSG